MADRPWGSAGLLLHPRPEVLEPLLGDVDVGLRQGAGPLLQRMEEYEERFPDLWYRTRYRSRP